MRLINKIKSVLQFTFPKPRIPQKRYVVIIVTIVYLGLKSYVMYTDDPYDDQLLEQAHEVIMHLLAEAKDSTFVYVNNAPQVSSPDATGAQIYGERS